ncbi:MAG: metal ABC transporter ATP-binding protein [Candidatus Acetothermia bacterium]|jgi:zinc/manganese transport system ATP-binding protein|nr:metal ABC transporter ATP-binding protein [Candidatus Acetothermia bacterium]MDH7504547.1 metal ABC transporter ATP-binding protein [Candidatus Acetothermia bacterium]
MGTPVIELRGVTTIYEGERIPAIHEIDLVVERGEFLALIGPNGVGKTTLLETINGLLDHKAGAVRLFGLDVRREGHRLRRRIGYIPQAVSFPELTPFLVRDVVLMARFGRIGLIHRPRAADYRAVERALELVGSAALARRPIGKLSGGQQQKVMLARAMAKEPELLLLDEPFSNLDFVAREEIASTIVRLHEELGLTTLIVLHDLKGLPPCCQRVVLMRAGRIFRDGCPDEVLDPLILAAAYQ